MFCLGNIQCITKYFLFCAIALSLECLASIETENELIVLETKNPLINWDSVPTVTPDGIRNQYPYLYFTTIVFAIIVLGTAFLVVFRSCFRTCRITTPRPSQSPAVVPTITRFRRSLVPTDAILINGRFTANGKPPDYATSVQTSRNITVVSQNERAFMVTAETPPPSYGSIV